MDTETMCEVVFKKAMASKFHKVLYDLLGYKLVSFSGGGRCVWDLINEIGLEQSKIYFTLKF